MRLQQIQALRALAAIAVIIFHAQGMAPKYTGDQSFSGQIMHGFGAYGVDLFFVISGFIIRFSAPSNGYRPKEFIIRRLKRIVPTYWVVTLIFIALLSVSPGIETPQFPSAISIVKSLFFIHFTDGNMPVVYVGWSLEYELFFYLTTFLLLLVTSAPWSFLLFIFSGLSIIGQLAFQNAGDGSATLSFLTSSLLIEFCMGVAIAEYLRTSRIRAVAAVALVLALVVIFIGDNSNRTILAGLPSALIVMAVIVLENKLHVTAPQFLVELGNASYSIYLFQVFSNSIVAKLIAMVIPMHHPDVFVCIVTGLSVFGGYIFYRSIELTISKALKKDGVLVSAQV